jgi:hypothetical protein
MGARRSRAEWMSATLDPQPPADTTSAASAREPTIRCLTAIHHTIRTAYPGGSEAGPFLRRRSFPGARQPGAQRTARRDLPGSKHNPECSHLRSIGEATELPLTGSC